MKINKRLKTVVIVGTITIGIVGIAFAKLYDNTNKQPPENNVVSKEKWGKKNPQFFNKVGYIGSLESKAPTPKEPSTNKDSTMSITNPFGIKDVVLEVILADFANNESAIYAAIRHEQYRQKMELTNNASEVITYAIKGNALLYCLYNKVGGSKSVEFIRKVDKIKTSSKAGMEEDKRIRKILGWQVLGYEKSFEEMDRICESGDY